MSKVDIRKEAVGRQGKRIGRFFIPGSSSRAEFEMGSEGLVHLAIEQSTNTKYRIKCFWEPTASRLQRTRVLVKEGLASLRKKFADALAGAPLEVIDGLGPNTPFAVVMKDVPGRSWRNLCELGQGSNQYPPLGWPQVEIRATWAYGLATAVKNMEERGFVHADLSPGNVMVTPEGNHAGDMALVDFDAFVHPAFNFLDSTCRGSEGYAAPEVWRGKFIEVGSDRVGMAILIQEFLVIGDPEVDCQHAFSWAYDQEREICSLAAEPHPLLKTKYPDVADLLIQTLRSDKPKLRPEPQLWRPLLRSIVDRKSLVTDTCVTSIDARASIIFRANEQELDLSTTPFAIRASLRRSTDGSVRIAVHAGAELRVKLPDKGHWELKAAGSELSVVPGLQIFDSRGNLPACIKA